MKGSVIPVSEVTERDIEVMYTLMTLFYEGTEEAVFRRDLADKDYCLLLREGTEIVGFTTQKLLTLEVDGAPVRGVFSGDTIIDRAHWGETELFRSWSQFWFPYAAKQGEFWWFLICKGYKTYRILPLFWEQFYPTFRHETPPREQRIMEAYAQALYPEEYDRERGVIAYRHEKDRLRPGVADADAHRLKNRDIAYFCDRNAGWVRGEDLVCLAKLDPAAMHPGSPRMLGL